MLVSLLENTGFILLLILIVFGIICLIVWLIRKYIIKPKGDIDDEEKIVEDDLNRYLETIDDENTQKEFEDFEKHQDNNLEKPTLDKSDTDENKETATMENAIVIISNVIADLVFGFLHLIMFIKNAITINKAARK